MPSDFDSVPVYCTGSPFQKWAYEQAARRLFDSGVRRYGQSKNGNAYGHLLHEDDFELNFLSAGIKDALLERFARHKAGDLKRARTNTVASQPCCFNLLVPMVEDLQLASSVFSKLMNRVIEIDHIELEFTPNQIGDLSGYQLDGRDESLGDQSGSAGTDADVAIFYRSEGARGVLLLEFKYIESEFPNAAPTSPRGCLSKRGHCAPFVTARRS